MASQTILTEFSTKSGSGTIFQTRGDSSSKIYVVFHSICDLVQYDVHISSGVLAALAEVQHVNDIIVAIRKAPRADVCLLDTDTVVLQFNPVIAGCRRKFKLVLNRERQEFSTMINSLLPSLNDLGAAVQRLATIAAPLQEPYPDVWCPFPPIASEKVAACRLTTSGEIESKKEISGPISTLKQTVIIVPKEGAEGVPHLSIPSKAMPFPIGLFEEVPKEVRYIAWCLYNGGIASEFTSEVVEKSINGSEVLEQCFSSAIRHANPTDPRYWVHFAKMLHSRLPLAWLDSYREACRKFPAI